MDSGDAAPAMRRTAQHWGHRARREWKRLLAFVLLWYAALVLGNQVLARDRHTAAPPAPPPVVVDHAYPAT
jgi:hypothetical protein